MKKILLVFGTRPEAIKMAPLVQEFYRYPKLFETKVCITAQHREMLDQVVDFFGFKVDYDLDLMKPNQNLYSLTTDIILSLKPILEQFKPDYVFVHGDTTTSMAASLASFYSESKICHVEAGLRTYDISSPFPEEMNRQLTSRIATYQFAPTEKAKENLLQESVAENTILVTGNTVIDALLMSVDKVLRQPSDYIKSLTPSLGKDKLILVTVHRRENHGKGLQNICRAIKSIASTNKDINILLPVHLNPKVREPVNEILSGIENVILTDPLSYPDFIWIMNKSYLILTDSGGIQEEAPSLGKPVLVLRDTTERPEAIQSGTVLLVGTDEKFIVSKTNKLLNDEKIYNSMSRLNNPYGNGTACRQIVDFMKKVK